MKSIAVVCLALAGFVAAIGCAWGRRVDVMPSSAADLAKVVSQAAAGDTLVLHPGIHRTAEVLVNKRLTILGRAGAVVDGGERGQVVTVSADGVWMEGMTIRNTARGNIFDYAAVKAIQCSQITLKRLTIENAFFGIYLSEVQDSRVTANRVTGGRTPETNAGNGFHLWQCKRITIDDNEVSGHRDGIYFEFVYESKIERNRSRSNLRYGLHFMFSNDNVYTGNWFDDNGAGVAVMYSKRVTMRRNQFVANRGGSAYGLLLKELSDCTIENNVFSDNTTGLFVDGCNRMGIRSNGFFGNGWAVRLMSNCVNDTLETNNFSGNTFDVSTNGVSFENRLASNYWDRYQGYDLNRDGVGDVPHHPVSLFSTIAERLPAALLLNRSLAAQAMDQVERVVPSLTPPGLFDAVPSLRPHELNLPPLP